MWVWCDLMLNSYEQVFPHLFLRIDRCLFLCLFLFTIPVWNREEVAKVSEEEARKGAVQGLRETDVPLLHAPTRGKHAHAPSQVRVQGVRRQVSPVRHPGPPHVRRPRGAQVSLRRLRTLLWHQERPDVPQDVPRAKRVPDVREGLQRWAGLAPKAHQGHPPEGEGQGLFAVWRKVSQHECVVPPRVPRSRTERWAALLSTARIDYRCDNVRQLAELGWRLGFRVSLELLFKFLLKGISGVGTIALSGRWFEQAHAKYARCTSVKCRIIGEHGRFKF
jgi:hypothetical protein